MPTAELPIVLNIRKFTFIILVVNVLNAISVFVIITITVIITIAIVVFLISE